MESEKNICQSAASTVAGNAATPAPSARRRRGVPLTKATALRVAAGLPTSPTKTAVAEALRNAGFAANADSTALVMQSLAIVQRARAAKLRRRTAVAQPEEHRRAPVLLPRGTPMQRLQRLRCDAVCRTAKRTLRYGAAGGTSFDVTFASSANQVRYSVHIDYNRDTYAGAYKGWRATEDHHRICVPADWRMRVERRGLAIVDGMMTLDAHELEPSGDTQIFAATWVRQGKGYSVVVDRGFIARQGTVHYHAASVQSAIAGARRKLRIESGTTPSSRSPYGLSIDEFIRRYARHSAEVSLDDARDTGSCEYGIRSWCASVGLDYESGSAPLSAVLEGFRALPMIEVRRAIVHAVRRHRAMKRATAR